jgi:uncharacterized protein with FMN-binding domain
MSTRMARSSSGRQRKRRRVGPRLVTLASSVILAAYGAGWAETRAFRLDAQISTSAGLSEPTTTPAPFVPRAVRAPEDETATPATVPTSAPATPRATPAVTYREGRYVASGESIHGGVTVAVVIFEGRIASAEIVKCETRYACTEIESLSEQAVERQSARLRYVSGATDSSRAYVKALEAALARAAA